VAAEAVVLGLCFFVSVNTSSFRLTHHEAFAALFAGEGPFALEVAAEIVLLGLVLCAERLPAVRAAHGRKDVHLLIGRGLLRPMRRHLQGKKINRSHTHTDR